jgi:hypothetical protein
MQWSADRGPLLGPHILHNMVKDLLCMMKDLSLLYLEVDRNFAAGLGSWCWDAIRTVAVIDLSIFFWRWPKNSYWCKLDRYWTNTVCVLLKHFLLLEIYSKRRIEAFVAHLGSWLLG